jgi:predicted regulator of Ras-like GTPase activity (Roadblock/LC7/MglB family)
MLNMQDVERDIDNLHRVQVELQKIVSEAGALGVFLVDENGFLIAEEGGIEIDRVALSALVARLLGEADFTRMTHQGSTRHLFIGKAGSRHILIVTFGRETNLGLVKLYAEKASGLIGFILDTDSVADEPPSDKPSEPKPGDLESGSLPSWMND